MTFVSFAQNCEDVMLWRALREVSNGFYVDVGAADPEIDSVTRAFYERGWHGINVEPEPGHAAALRAQRPRDINEQLAVGAKPGRATIHRIAGTGLSTLDPAIAQDHATSGYEAEPIDVDVATLTALLETHAPPVIHFLKIDAEGSEREILLGLDLARWRPWVIVIEATEPGKPVSASAAFEDLLLAADYRLRWFDGLNGFYIAAEQDDRLRHAFDVPPNVFDHFVPNKYVRLAFSEAKLEQAEQRLTEFEAAFALLEPAHAALTTAYAHVEQAYLALEARSSRELDAARETIRSRDHDVQLLNGTVAELQQAARRREEEVAACRSEIAQLRLELQTLKGRRSIRAAMATAAGLQRVRTLLRP